MSHIQELLAELGRHASFGRAARQLIGGAGTPRDLLDALLANGLHEDAIRFLPHLLTKQQAVWWGCQCSWLRERDQPNPAAWTILPLLLRWLGEPNEANRLAVAELASEDTPLGCMALAVKYSGGSLGLPELPAIAPPDHLTPKVVGWGVLLAAVEFDPAHFPETYRTFLSFGLDVLGGNSTWQSARTGVVEIRQPSPIEV